MKVPSEDFDGKLLKNASSHFLKLLTGMFAFHLPVGGLKFLKKKATYTVKT